MSAILLLLFFNALVIIGVHFATRHDQILGFVGDSIRLAPEWIAKPLIECPPCMSSVYGLLVWLGLGIDFVPLPQWKLILASPLYVFALCGLVRLVHLVLEATRKEAYEAPPE